MPPLPDSLVAPQTQKLADRSDVISEVSEIWILEHFGTYEITRNQEHISHGSPVIAHFLFIFSNFRYHGNRGWSGSNFTYTVKFANPENPLLGARIRDISPIEAQL